MAASGLHVQAKASARYDDGNRQSNWGFRLLLDATTSSWIARFDYISLDICIDPIRPSYRRADQSVLTALPQTECATAQCVRVVHQLRGADSLDLQYP